MYWFLKKTLFEFTCVIAFSNSRRHHCFLCDPLTIHMRFRFSSSTLLRVNCFWISAKHSSTKLVFGEKAAWIGPSRIAHVHLNLGTRTGNRRFGVRIVGCGFVHGRPGYRVHCPGPINASSSAAGSDEPHTLSCHCCKSRIENILDTIYSSVSCM